jgi:protein involved in polysaccharide export with SLBB domain
MCALLLLTGCQSTMPARTVVSPPDDDVVLGAGDTIDIKFFYSPEINDTQTLRPDGKISLPLLGDVAAAGKTPEELARALTALYVPLIERPKLTIIVRHMESRSVYVSGSVLRPGRVEMPARLSLLEAILQSGGFDPATAKLSDVLVLRIENDAQQGFLVDISDAMKGAGGKPFYLHPRDMVYVPQKTIVKIDQWIAQYINGIVPQFPFRVTRVTSTGSFEVDLTQYRR